MSVGNKIKSFRILQGLSQKQLGNLCNMSEATIKNYELGNTSPNENHLKKLAQGLNIDFLALYNYKLDSYINIIYTLFEFEEHYSLSFNKSDGSVSINFDNPIIKSYIKSWKKKNKLYRNGNINNVEYTLWKANFKENIEAQNTLKTDKKLISQNDKHLSHAILSDNFLYLKLDKHIQSKLDEISLSFTIYSLDKCELILFILRDYINYQAKIFDITLLNPLDFFINSISEKNELLNIEISINAEVFNILSLSFANWKKQEYSVIDCPIIDTIYNFIDNY